MTIKRLNYFHYQFLQEGEFQDEQSYHRDMRLSHNRSLHAWGIVEGLLVTGSSQTVTLGKGLAIDKDGKEIVIEADTDISIPNRPNATFYMAIEHKDDDHNEAYRSTQPGLTDKFTRVVETYEVSWPATAPGASENRLILARIKTDGSNNIVGTPDLTVRTEAGAKLGELAEIGELKFRLKNRPTGEWPGIKAAERTPTASGVQNLNVTAFRTNFSGDVEITGTLHVSTIVKQTELRIDDNIITVNTYPVQLTPKVVNGGLEVFRGGTAQSAQLIWDESVDRWKLGVEGALQDVAYGLNAGNLLNNAIADGLHKHTTLFSQVSGNAALSVDTAGNVGIGTTGPSAKLTVNSNISGLGPGVPGILIGNPSGTTAIWQGKDSNNYLEIAWLDPSHGRIFVAGSKPLVLQEYGGNVGIGTTDPQAMLHIAECVAIGPLALPAGQGRFHVAGTSAEIGLVRRNLVSWPATPAAGDRFIWYNPNGTARLFTDQRGDLLTVTSSGHVLIGTPPPTDNYIFEVAGRMKVRSGGGTETAGIWFSQTYGFAERAFVGMADNLNVGFWGNTGAGWGLLMNTTTGNVGIRTTNPNVRLAVNGPGTNVYATDIWAENNIHVQGNETLNQGGRGRLRIGTAWQYNGIYAESSSTGANNDLVLGASSGKVRIGPDGGGQSLYVYGPLVTSRAQTIKIGVPSPAGRYANDGIRGEPNLWLDAQATVFIKPGFQTPTGFDISERFKPTEPVEAADVVIFDEEEQGIKLCDRKYDKRVVGIISREPAFIMGGNGEEIPIALCGRVLCKVDADVAPIHTGDLLTTSPTKGYAQKVLDPREATGSIIGKSLGSLKEGKGEILVLVNLQ